MKTLWMILAGVCGLLAAYFVIREDFENAFVAAAGGAVCWFLNYRQQLSDKIEKEEEKQQEDSDEEVRS